jgi:hypothetical protein
MKVYLANKTLTKKRMFKHPFSQDLFYKKEKRSIYYGRVKAR